MSAQQNFADLTNAIVAICALAVAIASFFLSRSSLKAQEKHNKLSVRPIPFIALSKGSGFAIELHNHGFGPLIIKDWTIHGGDNDKYNLKDYIPKDEPPGMSGETMTGLAERSIPPQGHLTLISTKADKINDKTASFLHRCVENLSPLELEFIYTDIYSDNFPPYRKNLAWLSQFT